MLKVSVVSAHCSCEFPDTLYRVELRAVWRQEIEPDETLVFLQPRREKSCMMIACIIEYDHCEYAIALMSENLLQERQKRSSVERIGQTSCQVAVSVSDSSKDSNALSRGSMKDYWVNVFGRHTHYAP